jgi:phosphatidylserine/phosphatidylglycerophosphate/cardiolipin synthase-like enzyme
MPADILEVPAEELKQLVAGLIQGTIDPSSSIQMLRNAGVLSHAEHVHAWLTAAVDQFETKTALVAALRLVLEGRQRFDARTLTPEFILTGPEVEGVDARETRVVVRELFESARRSVLIVGYAFHGSAHIFEPLARRMSRNPGLQVRLVVNVHFERGRHVDEMIQRYTRDFLKDCWPFEPRPEVYYDHRSLGNDGSKRAVVHAKLIVVDEEVLYLGSANFTSAAFERNIEAGLRVKSSTLGKKASAQFEQWVRRGHLVALTLSNLRI